MVFIDLLVALMGVSSVSLNAWWSENACYSFWDIFSCQIGGRDPVRLIHNCNTVARWIDLCITCPWINTWCSTNYFLLMMSHVEAKKSSYFPCCACVASSKKEGMAGTTPKDGRYRQMTDMLSRPWNPPTNETLWGVEVPSVVWYLYCKLGLIRCSIWNI